MVNFKLLISVFLLCFFEISIAQEKDEKQVFDEGSETMPIYKGCEILATMAERSQCTQNSIMEFLRENTANPKGIESSDFTNGSVTVYARLLVTEEGKVDSVEIVHATSLKKEFSDAAIATIRKLPVFTPGQQNGKPVSVQYTVPIRFIKD